MANKKSKVEIAYASPEHTVLFSVMIPPGTTVGEAIRLSGFLEQFPELKLKQHEIGIFSKKVDVDTVVKEGDRIEIYRTLLIDPKEARRYREKGKL